MLSLIKLFQELGWMVHYASPAARGEHEVDLDSHGVQSYEIKVNCRSFNAFISELNPQAVLFDRFIMEEQFGWRVVESCPGALRLLDMEDMHSLRKARHEAVKKGLAYGEAELMTDQAKREVAAIFRCDLTLVISAVEMELLQGRYAVPSSLLVYCPFMLEPLDEPVPTYGEREHFLSIGNFRHAPNWDAVLQLKEHVWPQIRAQLPEVELHIYGAYPPPKAVQLHNEKEGFLVKGWAEEASAVMSQARVCLAPLRFGAGLKGKLAEAMICGTPSVTTPAGAEGMQGALEWPGVVTEDWGRFSQAAVSLYSEQEKWEEMQERGQRILEQRFQREVIVQRVGDRVGPLLHDLRVHREQNFIGAMLQHQSMKATQYMSQWIEEKNKA